MASPGIEPAEIPPLDPAIMRRAMDTAINAKAIADMDGRLSYVNRAFLSLWRLRAEAEALGRPVFDFWADAEACAAVVAALRDHGSFVGEMEGIRGSEAERFDVQVSASLVEDDAGRPVAMLASFLEVTETKRIRRELEASLARAERLAKEAGALFSASRLVLAGGEFLPTARSIFDAARSLTGATSGYIALLSEDGSENEVQFLEAGGVPCTVDPSLPMPIRGLREKAYRSRKSVWENDFMASEWASLMPEGHARLGNVLFAPLVAEGAAIGVMGLANKPGPFTQEDADLAESLAGLAALSLRNARAREELLAANKRLEGLWSVTSLQDADAKAISDHILESLARMTGSEFGFYGFVDPDETEMTIHSWSGRAMEACTMVDKPSCFSVASSGVWAEAIRRREPLLLNDYASPHAAKHGLPAGHVPLTRLLVVPHFSGGRISSVAAVANRSMAYGPADIAQIESFLSSVQAVVDAKLAETALRRSEEAYRYLFENALVGIARVERDGRYLSINRAFTRMFGYEDPEEILGTDIRATRFYADPADRDRLVADLAREGLVDRREMRFLRRDGSTFWGLISSRAFLKAGEAAPAGGLSLADFAYLDSYCIDITAQKEAEARLGQALETNKILLRELYHRTKNNMNVIASMIELQSLRLSDPGARAAFADVQSRIGAMSLVHQMLYRSADLSRVDFGDYARELAGRIARSFGHPGERVRLIFDIEPLSMLIDIVTPCGLILNELLTNSFKHAFRGHTEPAVRLSARRQPGGAIELSYADNGRGLGGVDPETSLSLGLVSLRALAEHQLQGRIRFGEEGGFRCTVLFSDAHYEERV